MRNLLLTGANGFIGSHLVPTLKADGYQVFTPEFPQFDVLNPNSLNEFVSSKPWDVVIHLAGMSHVMECEKNPELARSVNAGGTYNILQALKQSNPQCHFVLASTAQVYAAPIADEVNAGVTFFETRALVPQNFYARTKLEAERFLQEACETQNLSATVLRLFNHTHKTQAPTFFMPHIYHQLLEFDGKPIPVGNLDVERDIGSIRDLVQGISALLKKQNWRFEIFNICSGKGKNLKRLARGLSERMNVRADFVVDPTRVRPGEPTRLVGSHDKLSKLTGWAPKALSESQLVDDFLCD